MSYSQVFDQNNRENWPYLKNTELGHYTPRSIEDELLMLIYATGRDLAVHMSFKLQGFNDANAYPTLKKYVDSFDNGWLYEINQLEQDSEEAKKKSQSLGRSKWAIEQMIKLYDKQIDLLYEIKKIVESLRCSETYQWESGSLQQNYTSSPYQDILQSIVTIGRGFERNPSTYSSKKEESLRDFILIALQSTTPDSVTGETFNKRGKTDLLADVTHQEL